MKKVKIPPSVSHNAKSLTLAASVAAVLGAPAAAWSNPILLYDSYVSTLSPESNIILPDNHGAEANILLNKSNTGYIAFILNKSSLPSDLNSTDIDKATLTLLSPA